MRHSTTSAYSWTGRSPQRLALLLVFRLSEIYGLGDTNFAPPSYVRGRGITSGFLFDLRKAMGNWVIGVAFARRRGRMDRGYWPKTEKSRKKTQENQEEKNK